jgi:hypothetical protein
VCADNLDFAFLEIRFESLTEIKLGVFPSVLMHALRERLKPYLIPEKLTRISVVRCSTCTRHRHKQSFDICITLR